MRTLQIRNGRAGQRATDERKRVDRRKKRYRLQDGVAAHRVLSGNCGCHHACNYRKELDYCRAPWTQPDLYGLLHKRFEVR
jgi:hypothetical protein